MGIKLTGNHAQLDGWSAKLGKASDVMRLIASSLSEETITLVSLGFRKTSDPYGGRWAPRKSAGGGSSLLVQTGAMRASFHVSNVSSSGFTVSSGMAYTGFHQSGTSRMAARRMLPNSNDIPGPWERSYDEAAEDVMDMFFGG